MFPTFSSLIAYFTGWNIPLPINTFGLFVAFAFFAAYWAFTQEFKRKEKLGYIHPFQKMVWVGKPASIEELVLNGVFGFILGYKIIDMVLNYHELIDDTQGFLLSARGNWLGGILGAGIFAYWAYYEKKKQQLPEPKEQEVTVHPYELMGNILLYAAVAGFIGAKVFNALENWDEFMRNPKDMLIGLSGLTFYGGLICGGIAVLYYANKHGIKPLTMLDIGAPGMMLSYAIGRIGCQMAGDGDWGIDNLNPKPHWLSWLPDWMWSFSYPGNVNDTGDIIASKSKMVWDVTQHRYVERCKFCHVLTHPVYPTPFYETVVCLILFFILWRIRHKIKIPGVFFGIYLIMAGVERFFIELIRVNTKYHVAGIDFTQAELISICIIIVGIILVWPTFRSKTLKTGTNG